MEIKSISIKKPSKGDVIWAVRLPFHCGIYESDDSVYHFAPLNDSKIKEDAVIHRSTLTEFANGSPFIVIEFQPEKSLPPEESIFRACSRLDENTYSLLINNCDHFATWCKIGEHRSLQVELVKKIVMSVCKHIDKSDKKNTEFTKIAGFFFTIYEIAEVFASPDIKKILHNTETSRKLT